MTRPTARESLRADCLGGDWPESGYVLDDGENLAYLHRDRGEYAGYWLVYCGSEGAARRYAFKTFPGFKPKALELELARAEALMHPQAVGILYVGVDMGVDRRWLK